MAGQLWIFIVNPTAKFSFDCVSLLERVEDRVWASKEDSRLSLVFEMSLTKW